MTADRAAALVTRWVRRYTRRLPAEVAARRAGEIHADLHDHIAEERSRGVADRRIALAVLGRMARGLPADVVWSRRHRTRTGDPVKSLAAVLAVAVALVALGVATLMYAQHDDAPGLGMIGLVLIAGAVVVTVRTIRRRRQL